MNCCEIEDILKARFHEVCLIDGGLYRAEDRIHSRTASIHLVDSSALIARNDFDLRRFEDDVLRKEYHRVTGSLQWNLYCYLLCDQDEYDRLLTTETIEVIEADRLYARKFVRTIEQLRKELQPRNQRAAIQTCLPADVAGIWSEKCESSSMSVLSSELAYTEIARRIEMGNADNVKHRTGQRLKPITATAPITGVTQLLPRMFRTKIDGRKFSFGEINLICGPNGSGKTSILEAIELWMCGSSLRNPGPLAPLPQIDVMRKGVSAYVGGPQADRAIYRAREKEWYSAHQKKIDTLAVSFSRFTFFDSDAAVRLQLAPDSATMCTAIQDLVLGEETARLRKQFSSVLDLLRRRLRECEQNMKAAVSQRKKARESLALIQRPTGELSSAASSIQTKLLELKWVGVRVIDSADQVAALASQLTDAQVECDTLTSDRLCGPEVSAAFISEAVARYGAIQTRLEQVRLGLRECQKLYDGHRDRVTSIEAHMTALKRIDHYLESGASRLWGHDVTLEQTKTRHSALCGAIAALGNIQSNLLESFTGSCGEYETRLDFELTDAREAHAAAKCRLEEAKSHVGKLNSLASEALEAGRQYVAADPSANICPVCLTEYSHQQLVDRVTAVRPPSSADLLAPHLNAARTSKLSVITAETRLSGLRSLYKAAESLMPTTPIESVSLQALLNEVKKWSELAARCERELIEQRTEGDRLRSMGYSIEELQQLLQSTGLAATTRRLPDHATVQTALHRETDRLEVEQAAMRACLPEKTSLDEKLKALDEECEAAGLKISDIKDRLSHLRNVQSHVERLRERVRFGDTLPLSDVGAKLKSLSLLLDAYVRLSHEYSSVEQALENIRGQITKADMIISHEKPILDRLENGIQFINQLTSDIDPEKALSDFLSSTQREIGERFRAIHSPQEFSGVVVGPDGILRAQRKKGGYCCGVSELSSGQRSALGIALFLVMNQLATNAPRIIMMDDPVAHVDDLNALSFFDCLREITADGSRQLFFATASGKAAGLFQKKFDYLGDNFVVHQLSP